MVMAFDAVPDIPADMTHMMSIINKKLSDQHNDHVHDSSRRGQVGVARRSPPALAALLSGASGNGARADAI